MWKERWRSMCESAVYIREEEADSLYMSDAEFIEDEGGIVTVRDIAGSEKRMAGRIKKIDCLNHKIFIEKT